MNPPIDYLSLIFGLLGGLALFLYALNQLTQAVKGLAGNRLREILAQMTQTSWRGAFSGALITAAFQSSSVTTVLVVGFISSGLMTLQQSVGIILGANVGSTFTAQVIAFNVTEWAMAMVAVGFGMSSLCRKESYRLNGMVIFSLGLLFLGMDAMGSATNPLRSHEPFLNFMRDMESPLLAILAGAIFTAVVQSSGATSGIVIVFASQGLITLDAGIALVLGANIGTCVTALLAAIGKSREALQAAVFHTLFNVVGSLAWVAFIPFLAGMARMISPSATGLEGLDRLAYEVPRQIANAHTLFNVINLCVFIGFASQLASVVRWLIPAKPEKDLATKPKYLQIDYLQAPDLALDAAGKEISRMVTLTAKMMHAAPAALKSRSKTVLSELADLDESVDTLQKEVLAYFAELGKEPLTAKQQLRLQSLLKISTQVEGVADLISGEIVQSGHRLIRDQVQVSEETENMLRDLAKVTMENLKLLRLAILSFSPDHAKIIIESRRTTSQLIGRTGKRIEQRLSSKESNRVGTYRVEMELLETYRRLNHACRRVAKVIWESSSADGKNLSLPVK